MRAMLAVVLALGLFGGIISFWVYSRATPLDSPEEPSAVSSTVPSSRAAPGPDGADLGALRRQMAEFDQRLADLETKAATFESVVRGRAVRDSAFGTALPPAGEIEKLIDAALEERLEEVATEIQEDIATLRRSPIVIEPTGAIETEELQAAIVAENQAIATDLVRTSEDRIRALRELRFRDGGRSLEVTRAMIGMIEDPSVESGRRADIIRNLDGVTFPELKRPLIHAVLNDADPEVREEAAETLGEYLKDNDAEVAEILTRVSEADGSNKVRFEALQQLQGWRGER